MREEVTGERGSRGFKEGQEGRWLEGEDVFALEMFCLAEVKGAVGTVLRMLLFYLLEERCRGCGVVGAEEALLGARSVLVTRLASFGRS